MKYYFTFGQQHAHHVNGFTYDKDVVVVVNAKDERTSREIMFEHFGAEWAFQYNEEPNMEFFPRGLKELNQTTNER